MNVLKYKFLFFIVVTLIMSCSSNDDMSTDVNDLEEIQTPQEEEEEETEE